MSEEDRALLLGHAMDDMPQHYASATVARLVEAANKVANTRDRTTLLRVVNGQHAEKSRSKEKRASSSGANPLF